MPKYVAVSRGRPSAVGELEVIGGRPAGREWNGDHGCHTWVAAKGPHGSEGEQGMAEASRHWDGAGLERKIRAAGRPWTVGDIAMVADGQWGVGAQPTGGRAKRRWWSAASRTAGASS